jgi:hypothetical protein
MKRSTVLNLPLQFVFRGSTNWASADEQSVYCHLTGNLIFTMCAVRRAMRLHHFTMAVMLLVKNSKNTMSRLLQESEKERKDAFLKFEQINHQI